MEAINDVSFELFPVSLGIVPSALSLAIISCGDMDNVSIAKRDGVCDRDTDRDTAREEHLEAGLELREWRKSSKGISSDL